MSPALPKKKPQGQEMWVQERLRHLHIHLSRLAFALPVVADADASTPCQYSTHSAKACNCRTSSFLAAMKSCRWPSAVSTMHDDQMYGVLLG